MIKYIFLLTGFLNGSYAHQKLNSNFTSKQYDLSHIVLAQANCMGESFIQGNYALFCHYIHPAIIRAMGGENKMSKSIEDLINNMKNHGINFKNITFSNVSKIVREKNELQCTLIQLSEVATNNGTKIKTSTLIAISNNDGENWAFIDTSNKNSVSLKKLLPNLSDELKIFK